MPTIRQIFGNAVTGTYDKPIIVRDRKPKQCSQIFSIEEFPYIRRCHGTKMHNLDVCKDCAFSVSYFQDGSLHTAYFSTVGKAEYFKKRTPGWTETNYDD